MTARVYHRDRAGAAMQPLFDHLEATLDFDCTVPPTGGCRTDAMQLVEWQKGRALVAHDANPMLQASWHVVAAREVVTRAFGAGDSGHGHSGAADILPVRSIGANGLPASVWLGNETSPEDRAEAVRLQNCINEAARAVGYECGADWPEPDGDHYQVPNWRSLPRYVAAA